MKRLLVVMSAIIALVLATSVPASAAGGDALGIIKAKTGKDAVLVTGAQSVNGLSVGVGHDGTGKALVSYTQVTTATSIRMLSTITDSSQTVVSYALGIPSGAEVKAQPDGSQVITQELAGPNGVEVFGTIAPPWASDANGQSLPTAYTYSKGVLSQKVDLTNAVFPVVADPWVTWGWYIYINFSRSETLRVAASSSYGQLAVVLCGMIAPAVGAVACGIFYGWILIDLYAQFNKAAHLYNTCATMLLNYALFYNGVVLRRC